MKNVLEVPLYAGKQLPMLAKNVFLPHISEGFFL